VLSAPEPLCGPLLGLFVSRERIFIQATNLNKILCTQAPPKTEEKQLLIFD
jgi:hypothetical protein